MGDVEIGGEMFKVERLSEQKFPPAFVLYLRVANPDEIEFPKHELKTVLDVSSRQALTDAEIGHIVEEWMENHPSADVDGFGIIEERLCRTADRKSDLQPHQK